MSFLNFEVFRILSRGKEPRLQDLSSLPETIGIPLLGKREEFITPKFITDSRSADNKDLILCCLAAITR